MWTIFHYFPFFHQIFGKILCRIVSYRVVYKITCPCCVARYVGCTIRHLTTHFREHKNQNKPVGKHMKRCKVKLGEKDIEILARATRDESYLMTLEALWIREEQPELNTLDEYKQRILTVKW